MANSKSFEWGQHLPTLQAPRVTLRALTEADVADVFSIFADPMVLRYWDGPPMATHQDAMQYIERIHYGFRRRELLQWAIIDAAARTVIGTATLTHLSAAHERAEIGFALKQKRWGQGLGSEAVVAVMNFAFEAMRLHRIEADVDPRNERSLRLLQRLGFQREGYLRERYFMNGERQDAVMMSMLRADWRPGTRNQEPSTKD